MMDKIRDGLGFGTAGPYTQGKGKDKKIYHRFRVSAEDDLTRLVHLFNGNLLADKVQKRYERWLQMYNQRYCVTPPILSKPWQLKVSLQTDWLAGFIDAEGGFFASFRAPTPEKAATRAIRLVLKTSITQKHERILLENIRDLIVPPGGNQMLVSDPTEEEEDVIVSEPYQFIHDAPKNVHRLELGAPPHFAALIKYFSAHPLRGSKRLVFFRWRFLVANADIFKKASGTPETKLVLFRKLVARLLVYKN